MARGDGEIRARRRFAAAGAAAASLGLAAVGGGLALEPAGERAASRAPEAVRTQAEPRAATAAALSAAAEPPPAPVPGASSADAATAEPAPAAAYPDLVDPDPLTRLEAVLDLRADRSEAATAALHRLLQTERAPVVRGACADVLAERGAMAPPTVAARAGGEERR